MNLIEYNDYQIIPTQECFLIAPLRKLYEKDKSEFKTEFMSLLSILYFMCDPRSSYNYIIDENDRLQEILKQEGLPKNYKISKDLEAAMDIYQKHVVSTSSLLLQDTRIAVDKVRQFLRDVDLNATDKNGKPLYTINSITLAVKQIPQLTKELQEAEDLVKNEIAEQSKARGSAQKKLFEDGCSFDFD